jgi:hypothetical protein
MGSIHDFSGQVYGISRLNAERLYFEEGMLMSGYD